MPRGDKSSYTPNQKRKAGHIEEGYETRGVKKKEAERRAWATVNKQEGGGKARAAKGRPGESKSTSRSKGSSRSARPGQATRSASKGGSASSRSGGRSTAKRSKG